MRIGVVCPECSTLAGNRAVLYVETIREDGVYRGQCPKAHQFAVLLQTLHHEMLFEIALNAITDGYYRESVSSFAASVERFYEFAIRVMAKKGNVDPTAFDQAWKQVSKQSERQLGAYVFLYVASFGEMPPILSNAMTEFRNGVIHRGQLPTREKALQFGGEAYAVIQAGTRKLRDACLGEVNQQLGEDMAQRAERAGGSRPRTVQVTPTALNIIEDISNGYKPFEQVLAQRGITSAPRI